MRENVTNVLAEDFEEEEDSQRDKYLTFKLADEEYGIEIYSVREVVGLQRITAIPDMPAYIRGVVNLRGQVIPIMDVRSRFNMSLSEYNDRTCVIVINVGDMPIGLIVDEVQDVLDISETNIAPPPNIVNSNKEKFMHGLGMVEDQVKIILDVRQLVDLDLHEKMALCS